MLPELTGQVALVTGAGRGIGRGIAGAMAEAGAAVILTDINGLLSQEAAEELRERGFSALAIAADVADRNSMERLVGEALDQFGQIHILVNNAGIADNVPAIELSQECWNRVLAVNLSGVMWSCQIVGQYMMERKYGRIVNISSSAANFGAPNLAAYSASKAGILGLTRTLAVEWGAHGITVNAVCPNNIDTAMVREIYKMREAATRESVEDMIRRITHSMPVGRLGRVEDVANLVVFLASPAAEFITGQAISVCGGRTINLS